MTGKNPAVLCFFCLDSARVCANTAARHAYWWLSDDGAKRLRRRVFLRFLHASDLFWPRLRTLFLNKMNKMAKRNDYMYIKVKLCFKSKEKC